MLDPTSGKISKKIHLRNLKTYVHSHIHCRAIYNRQEEEASQMSNNRVVGKIMWQIHTMKYNSALEKKIFCNLGGLRRHYAK
jgi:hypothetical protein